MAVISLILPQFTLQVSLWLILSTLLIWLSRSLFTPKHTSFSRGDDHEAETLTEIPSGKTGRVIYEGNSWRAKCASQEYAIAPNEKVYVVRREGNTLIVVPETLLNS